MELIIFMGLQASGKSEFYKQTFYKTHLRLNLDMLHTRTKEKILLEACIKAKQPSVIDNTNPTKEGREKYITLAKTAGFAVKGYYFQSAIKDCIQRNAQRTGKEKLPSVALYATHSKLELPSIEEGFDELYYVSLGEKFIFHVEEYNDEI